MGAEHKIDDAMSRDEKRYYAKVTNYISCLLIFIFVDSVFVILVCGALLCGDPKNLSWLVVQICH